MRFYGNLLSLDNADPCRLTMVLYNIKKVLSIGLCKVFEIFLQYLLKGKNEKRRPNQSPFFVCVARGLKFVVLYYIFRELYELFTDPHGLYDLKVGAEGDKHAQKLLYVMELAYVFVSGLP